MKNLRSELFLVLMFLSASVFAGIYTPHSVPDPKQYGQNCYVSNPDGILSQATVDSLNRIALLLEQYTGDVEMAIVAIGSMRLNEEEEPNTCDIFQFSLELFNYWGVGKASTNKGLLITLVKDARKVYFSTGDNLDVDLPDAVCYEIQQEFMVPRFREGDYEQGLLDGVRAVYEYLINGDIEQLRASVDDEPFEWWEVLLLSGVLKFFLLLFFLGMFSGFGGGGGRGGGGSSRSYSSSSSGSWGGGRSSGGGAGSSW